tara:strand:+ start:131 stop:805 length:675 start_codon:yes stop_codon:yes gene_type:complete
MKKKILIVDDEPDILEFLSYNLKKEGYEIETSKNGKQALKKVSTFHPNLIVIDIMMPEMDGIETCSQIRSNTKYDNIYILFLTARSEDYTHIASLESGADDFISKPIKPRLLISKINSIFRRLTNIENKSILKYKNIIMDTEKYKVLVDNKDVALAKKEFELIKLFLQKPGKVFTRKDILESIWGADVYVGDRTIDVHVNRVREKIGQQKIVTIKGVGYKLIDS